MTKFIEKYFAILKNYFSEAVKIAANANFVREKYDPKLRIIYNDPALTNSIADSLYGDLAKIDWGSQEKEL